ncbi:hypothetical protein EPN96_11675 [bacterium]|nr:MAG: hypothetical protein EPN96_11675 [bacterium]
MKKLMAALLILTLAYTLTACGGGGGGGSEAPRSAAIKGTVVSSSDLSAARGGLGLIVNGKYSVPGAVCTLEGTDKSGITDIEGNFTINGVGNGSYILICKKELSTGDVLVALQILEVTKDGTDSNTVNLGTIEISAEGTIVGKALLIGQSEHTGIKIYVPGTSFQANTDATGAFKLDLPAGTYDLVVEKTGYTYQNLVGIMVKPGRTTDIGVLPLSVSIGPSGSVSINNGAELSDSETVTLSITHSADASLMKISEKADFSDVASWEPVAEAKDYTFASGGLKTIYIIFENADGLESGISSDSINLNIDAPIAATLLVNAPQNTPVSITLSATDPDGVTDFNFSIISPPVNGALSVIPNESRESVVVTYTPNAGFYGYDSFTYMASDGLKEDSAIIEISVMATWYEDKDGDGYTSGLTLTSTSPPGGYVLSTSLVNTTSVDCNDLSPFINPEEVEICDGVDNDCSGGIDDGLVPPLAEEQLGVCSGATKLCSGASGWEEPDYFIFSSEYESSETNCDSKDNDCDGQIDEGLLTEYWLDLDGDSYGDPLNNTNSCTQSATYVLNSNDCDDSETLVNPGAYEIDNGIDDDCDGQVDEMAVGDIYVEPKTGFKFSWVPPGSFQMGDTYGDGNPNELPVHTVTFSKGFWMGTYEITQEQWKAFMGNNPSYYKSSSPGLPIEQVSLYDIIEFIGELKLKTGVAFRLPSEAEWEYAAKGAQYSGTKYSGTSDQSMLLDYAWFQPYSPVTSAGSTHPVGQKLPNALGLYDMSGNVMEWVEDYYSSSYSLAPTDGSAWGDGSQGWAIARGGDWYSISKYVRTTWRFSTSPSQRNRYIGLRFVIEP